MPIAHARSRGSREAPARTATFPMFWAWSTRHAASRLGSRGRAVKS